MTRIAQKLMDAVSAWLNDALAPHSPAYLYVHVDPRRRTRYRR